MLKDTLRRALNALCELHKPCGVDGCPTCEVSEDIYALLVEGIPGREPTTAVAAVRALVDEIRADRRARAFGAQPQAARAS